MKWVLVPLICFTDRGPKDEPPIMAGCVTLRNKIVFARNVVDPPIPWSSQAKQANRELLPRKLLSCKRIWIFLFFFFSFWWVIDTSKNILSSHSLIEDHLKWLFSRWALLRRPVHRRKICLYKLFWSVSLTSLQGITLLILWLRRKTSKWS